MAIRVRLPANGWVPRGYQRPLWDYLEGGGTRAFAVWHRRSGKDDVGLHWTAIAAHQRVGTYWYMLPEQTQGRKAIWEAVNPKTGKRRIDEAFPEELRETTRANEMFIKFASGSTWQVVGSDNYNALVGSPPIGIVASEWALAKPAAWAYLRPILRENGGWALFNTTPRGKNHAHRMLIGAQSAPAEWFSQVLPAKQTDVFTAEQLALELLELQRDYGKAVGLQMFDQEYMCSFEQPVVGAIYAGELSEARNGGRIGRVPYDPMLPVQTWWDIGGAGQGGDATAIWFVQVLGAEIRCIRYYEASGHNFAHYVAEVERQPYRYSKHWLPHDARAKALGTGRSIEEMAREMLPGPPGEQKVGISPAVNVEDRIAAARMIFPRVYIDESNCAEGIDALTNYRREWVDKLAQLSAHPLHDWSSHGSDAFGEMALTVKEAPKPRKKIDARTYGMASGGVWG